MSEFGSDCYYEANLIKPPYEKYGLAGEHGEALATAITQRIVRNDYMITEVLTALGGSSAFEGISPNGFFKKASPSIKLTYCINTVLIHYVPYRDLLTGDKAGIFIDDFFQGNLTIKKSGPQGCHPHKNMPAHLASAMAHEPIIPLRDAAWVDLKKNGFGWRYLFPLLVFAAVDDLKNGPIIPTFQPASAEMLRHRSEQALSADGFSEALLKKIAEDPDVRRRLATYFRLCAKGDTLKT